MSEFYKDPVKEAAEQNLKLVLPESSQHLLVDIDSEDDEIHLLHMIHDVLASNRINVEIEKSIPSRSGEPGHKHYYLRISGDDLILHTPVDRILLQAVLGSDRKRELLSYLRLRRTSYYPTVFFEKADTPPVVSIPDDELSF